MLYTPAHCCSSGPTAGASRSALLTWARPELMPQRPVTDWLAGCSAPMNCLKSRFSQARRCSELAQCLHVFVVLGRAVDAYAAARLTGEAETEVMWQCSFALDDQSWSGSQLRTVRGSAASWLFSPRRQALNLQGHSTAFPALPNV